ncbi:MAG TPA: YeeE/YedE thiosulfate transporter family protein [Chitinophagales bacterium]|nr:YeeE/YedE thiosulfate transporter family protein [Chitinophagales bacterium]
MFKNIKFLLLGVFFGIVMAKAQVISWFRIYEMFRFESFHMYGIIGSAVVLGVIIVQFIKRSNLKSIDGTIITIEPKPKTYKASIFGGILFGLGWALVGACPGPIYVLIGAGFYGFIIVLLSALFGTFCYGLVKDKLPH